MIAGDSSLIAQDEDLMQFVREVTRFESAFLGASSLASVTQGGIIQLNRKGFYICDQVCRCCV